MTPRQLAMLASVSAIWGASYLLIKIALDGFAPSMIVFARVLLAALLLYVVILIRGGEDRAALRWLRRHPRRTLVQGTLAVAIPFMLISLGETQISSGPDRRADLTRAAVHRDARAADRPDREGRSPRPVSESRSASRGVALLIGVDTIHSTRRVPGRARDGRRRAGLRAGSDVRAPEVPRVCRRWWSSFAACGVAAVLTLPPALATLGENSPDVGEIAAVVSLGAIGTAVAFYLYFGLIGEAGAGKAALCGYLIPPLALAYGAVLLDEEITPASIAGLVLILLGVALASGERGRGDARRARAGSSRAERRAS